mmetsp:Transcript_93617/g.264711  ORF Transcript_93617/g.264711 Transcript_93617/m.264711 type:complete len:185 (-) Transcript_93617:326-880(-)
MGGTGPAPGLVPLQGASSPGGPLPGTGGVSLPDGGLSQIAMDAMRAQYENQAAFQAAAQAHAAQQQIAQLGGGAGGLAALIAAQQQQQAAGWQQQLAQRAGVQMPAAMAQQLGAQQMAGRQEYDQLRQQAAYYAYLAQADQQRQQGGAQAAAAQAAFAQQGGYQQAGAQFGYGAAAYGSRGERI